jgi:phosphate:Na+ symporter
VGVIIIYPFIVNGWYERAVFSVSGLLGDMSVERLVANSHSLFNILWSLFWVWQIPLFSRIIKSLLKGEEKTCLQGTAYLDRRLLQTPSLAVDAVRKELYRMATVAHEMLDSQIKNIAGDLPYSEAKRVWELENLVNEVQRKTLTYLRDIHGENISDEMSQAVSALMQSVDDIERWGDHATNLFEISEFIFENNVRVNEGTKWIIKELYSLVNQNIMQAINTFNLFEYPDQIMKKAVSIEQQIDQNVKDYRSHRSETYISGETEVESALVFTDIIMNLERVADHAFNIIQLNTSSFSS